MNYWLMKNEPSSYSIENLQKDKKTVWDSIRNYQVRNMLRDEVKVGDLALFYHSGAGDETGVAGVMEIVKAAYPDPTQFDKKDDHYDPGSKNDNPRWLAVDVKYKHTFPEIVTLATLRGEGSLKNMRILQKGNRLSVTPITKAEFTHICKLGGYNI